MRSVDSQPRERAYRKQSPIRNQSAYQENLHIQNDMQSHIDIQWDL